MGIARRTLLLAAAASAATAVRAQPNWPNRPIRLVVPYSAGGPTDVLARAYAQRLTETLGQTVVVDNKPGANTIIGAEAVARSAPDGYTLLLVTGTALTINQHLYPKLPYDPQRDFVAVGKLAMNPYVLYAHPKVAAKDGRELLAWAKAHPGELNVGLPGNATPPHFAIKALELASGTRFNAVQYKGSALALNDLLAGHIDLVVDSPVVGLPHVAAGRLKALAVTAPARMPNRPELGTIAEIHPGYEASSWFGIVAPAGTPADAVARLNAETQKFLRDPAVRDRLLAMGMVPEPGSADDLAAFIRAETERWRGFIQRTGLTLE